MSTSSERDRASVRKTSRTQNSSVNGTVTLALAALEEARIAMRSLRKQRETKSDTIEISILPSFADFGEALRNAQDALESSRTISMESDSVATIIESCKVATEQFISLSKISDFSFEVIHVQVSKIQSSARRINSATHELLKSTLVMSESERARILTIIDRAEYQSAELNHSARTATEKLHDFQSMLNAETARLEHLRTSAEELRKEQSVHFRAELSSLTEERARVLAEAREELNTAVGVAREEERKSAELHVQKIEKLLDQSKLAASKVANDTIASYYTNSANKEVRSARLWSATAIVTGVIISVLVVTVVIISIFKPVENTFAAVLRILAPLIGSPIFVYATLEARQHRKRSWDLDDAAITHSTIGAMISPLPQEMQHSVLLQTATRMYVNGKQSSELPADARAAAATAESQEQPSA
ncbi:hypothetical protein [Saccharopolyspora sp. ASAGF58]|uniref:hypothetical protein n=1 Tax=Saccharopolyspora sp. ASAGF58 TaxID=2719023 RepID=UPI00143FF1E7|nr:hypothetical protein [Saccharopolyspora sp. ASAGF58]QIZ36478.1 hypothetical protein FDZ84_19640 [Saccharopolyspora sp. ASAGF58]